MGILADTYKAKYNNNQAFLDDKNAQIKQSEYTQEPIPEIKYNTPQPKAMDFNSSGGALQSQKPMNAVANIPQEPTNAVANILQEPTPKAPQMPQISLNASRPQNMSSHEWYLANKDVENAKSFSENLFNPNYTEREKLNIVSAQLMNQKGLISTLLQSKDEEIALNKSITSDIDRMAKFYGFDGAFYDENANQHYYITTDKNGQVYHHPIKPNFGDHLTANSGEIALGVATAPLGAGLATARGLGAVAQYGAGMLGSSLGAGVGAVADSINRNAYTTNERTMGEHLSRGGEAMLDDLGAGALVGAGAKVLGKGYNAVKNADFGGVGRAVGGVYDKLPTTQLTKYIVGDNAVGAESALAKNLGGATNERMANQMARNALGDDIYKNFTESNINKHIPNVGENFTTINKGIDNINKKILDPVQNTIKIISGTQNIHQREVDMLLSSLAGGDNGARVILDTIAHDPTAFQKAVQLFKAVNNETAHNIKNLIKADDNAYKIFDNYAKGTKSNYGAIKDELLANFNGKVKLDNESLQTIANQLDTLYNLKLPKEKTIRDLATRNLANGEMDLKSILDLRERTNSLIGRLEKIQPTADTYHELQALNALKDTLTKGIDDLFESYANTSVGAKAKELYKQINGEYSNFKGLENSKLYQEINSKSPKSSGEMTDIFLRYADSENGAINTKEFLDNLPLNERARIESAFVRDIIDNHTNKELLGVNAKNEKIYDEVIDFKAVMNDLDKLPIETEQALNFKNFITQSGGVLNNTGDILKTAKNMNPKAYALSQGISHNVESRFWTMLANRTTNIIKSRIPIYGNDQALKNHIANALKNSGGKIELAIKNMGEIPPNMPPKSKAMLDDLLDTIGRDKTQRATKYVDEYVAGLNEAKATLKSLGGNEADELIKGIDTSLAKLSKDSSERASIVRKLISDENSINSFFVDYKSLVDDMVANTTKTADNLAGDTAKIEGSSQVKLNNSNEVSNLANTQTRANGGSYSEIPNNSSLTDNIAKNSDEVTTPIDDFIAKNKADESIKGDNFTITDSGKPPYQYAEQPFNPEQWINDLSGVLSDEWSANLKSLAIKHPEMFKSESDVFRLIKEIKDNPTHFFKNYDDEVALIGKNLGNGKAGNIGVVKENGKIIHANKTKDKFLQKLVNRQENIYQEQGIKAGSPLPTTSTRLADEEDALLHNALNDDIIPQKTQNQNSFTDEFWEKKMGGA